MERRDFLKGSLASMLAAASISPAFGKDPDEPKVIEHGPLMPCMTTPVEWAERYLHVDLWDKQKEILRAIASNDQVAVRLGHALGGTFALAVASLWWIYNSHPAIVLSATPTFRQHKCIFGKEISKLFFEEKKGFCSDSCLAKWAESDGYVLNESHCEWPSSGLVKMFLSFGGEPPRDEIDYSAENILFIIDEAGEVNPKIIEMAEKCVFKGNAKILALGKPLHKGTPFHKMHTGEISGYKTIKISSVETPNTKGSPWIDGEGENPYSYLVDWKWIRETIQKYGISSSIVRSRVFGEFPV